MTQLTIGLTLQPLAPTPGIPAKDPAARKGAQAALNHRPASDNPYPWDSHRWFQWRLAYFTQHLAISAPLLDGTVPLYFHHPAHT